MKTLEEIQKARHRVTADIAKGGLSPQQLALLTGMSVALQWVCDEGKGVTLERLVSGEQIQRAAAN